MNSFGWSLLTFQCDNIEFQVFIVIGLPLSGPFVENKGVEPLTSCVQSRRSSQLS